MEGRRRRGREAARFDEPERVLYEDRKEVVVANDGSVSEADFVVKNQAAAINRALKAAAAGGGGGDPHAGHSHD